MPYLCGLRISHIRQCSGQLILAADLSVMVYKGHPSFLVVLNVNESVS